MKVLKTAALTGIVIAAVVVLALEPASGAGTEWNAASCSEAAPGGAGSGRAEDIAAGPVVIAKGALGKMSRAANGDLYAKVPLLLEGDKAVTVSVPPNLRGQVFLYYGRVVTREGKVTTSFADARGYGETEFQPCSGRTQTVWTGGVRIDGASSVRLLVHLGGGAEPVPLQLGRPSIANR